MQAKLQISDPPKLHRIMNTKHDICWQGGGRSVVYSQPLSLRCTRPSQSLRSLPRKHTTAASAAATLDVDVAIVGGGIIGLSTALTLLKEQPQLSVALVENTELCAGATGAGQGYIWMIHRNPSSAAWKLAKHSKILWQHLLGIDTAHHDILSPDAVEWYPNGSMLIATSFAEAEALQQRQALLTNAGVRAKFLDAGETREIEPALSIPGDGGGLLVLEDSQINGRMAAATLLKACEAQGDRFHQLFYEPCTALVTEGTSGRVNGIETTNRRITARRGVVMAAGAWTGPFLAQQLGNEAWSEAVQPRRGHLLELMKPVDMPVVNHGLMEMGYTKHYATSATSSSAASTTTIPSKPAADVTFTATTSKSGTLLVGSSREFSGWEATPQHDVVESIMQHATNFLPGLGAVKTADIDVRVGLRPFSSSGPVIGPVAGVDGLFVATGHEGSGLTLGPATGELLVDYIVGRPHALPQEVVEAVLPKVGLVERAAATA